MNGTIKWDEAREVHAGMIAAGFWGTGHIE